MKALRFTFLEQKLEVTQIPKPKIVKPNEVLIKVAYAGVCGTDLHIMLGEYPAFQGPITLGHEFSGIVIEIGADVKALKVGDRISVDPLRACHSCFYCHSGDSHFCTARPPAPGVWRDGGWAEYVVAEEEVTHKLPDVVTLEQGALVEPFSCLTHGWDLISPITVGKKILVVGAGIIGNLWVCNLHLRGHKDVTVSEPSRARLDMLNKLGTGYTLITPQELKANQKADPNYLFDVIVDCTGFASATEHAVTLLRRGGKYCVFGVTPPKDTIKVNIFNVVYNGLSFNGVRINPYSYPKAIAMVETLGKRYLNFEDLGVKFFDLEEYREAIEQLKRGAISKAMFKLH